MGSKKNRGAYRATNLSANTSEEEFRSALLDQLTDEEKSELTLDCRLAPACTDPGTQIAIFKFKPLNPRPPSFLQTDHPSFLLQGRSILIDVEFFGLTQLYTTPREIKIDIVALSGLNSHAYGSWVGPEVGGTTPMWLQDFFSIDNDLKDCRVMTFGYNTKYNAKAKVWIEDYVKTFLTGLNKARGGNEEQRRPLVLIGHSFGGTIIEHAFVKASLGGEYANIYKSIAGIFLFGVPFRGIYLNDVISMLDDDWELASQGHELVRDIIYETQRITHTCEVFMHRITERKVPIYSFYEKEKTRRVIQKDGVYGRYGDYVIVVSKNSTVLETPGFESMPADGDHSTIVKLKSAQDDTYTTVRSRLKIIIQEAEAAEAERQARANDIFGLHGDRPSLDKTDLEKVPYVHSAAFDSETDELDARCHPETRKELLKQIKDWAQDPGGKCIFWLNGVAGTGKSTISRTVAHLFNDDDDIQLGASFFFKRGESNRDNASKFWTTIAVQLTRNIPGLVLHVQNAIQKEPDIATKTLEKQFRALVFHPLEKLIEANSSSVTSGDSAKRTLVPLVFVIDALDECEGDGRIRQILDFLAEMQKLKLVRVHIRIFLTSRPELPIRLGFDKMSADTHDRMILQDVPPATIEHDISVFLKWEFSKIRYTFNITQRECSGDFELPLDWPGADDIKRLTKMAIPLFIYASTVCRFVGDKLNWDPQQRLATILKYGTTYTEGGEDSQLNRTYLPVLKQLESGQSETQIEKFAQEFRTIIGSIVVVVDPLPISTLADLLGITKEKVNSKLVHLHSVLSIPDNSALPIRFLHLSFREFLVDPDKKRSETDKNNWFWIDEREAHRMMTIKCLDILSTHLKENICGLEYPGMPRKELSSARIDEHLPPHVRYSCRYWVHHLERSSTGKPIVDNDVIHTFLCKQFLYWLEALSIIGCMSEAIDFVETLWSLTEEKEGSGVFGFLRDARYFVSQNWHIVDEAPLQVYSSAIIFSPETSNIKVQFRNHIPKWVCRFPKSSRFWGENPKIIQAHVPSEHRVKFSPDDKKLVSASSVGTVGLWDVSTGQRIKFLNLKTNGFPIMAFSPDSKELVMSSGGGGLIAWDTATGQQIRDYEGDGRNISILLFSPDGKGLATVSDDTEASLWDVEAQQLMKTFKIGRRVTEISFCSEGKQLVALSSLHSGHYSLERWVELWDIPTGELVWSFSITSPPRIFTPPKANFSFDGGKLALIENGAVRIWNLATRRLEENLQRVGVPQVACYDLDRKQLVGAGNGELRFWNTEIGEKKRIIGQKAGRGKGCDIASSRDGKRVAVALSDGILQLWDVDTHVDEANAHSMKTTRGGDADITAMTLSPDGTKLLLTSRSTTIFWDTASEQPIKTFKDIVDVAFSPNSKFMALAMYRKARLFDLSDVAQPKTTLSTLNIKKRMFRRSVQPFRGGVYKRDAFSAVIFSPDSQRLALGTSFGKITVLNTATGKLVKSFQGFGGNTLDDKYAWKPIILFSDDGKLLVLGTRLKIMVWDIETKQKLQQFEAESRGIQSYDSFRSLALSPDRKLLASASQLNLFQIWDMETGHLLEAFQPEYIDYLSRSLQFSSDNKCLETDRQTIFVSSSPLRIIPKPASSRILLRGGWVTQHGQNILWLPHSNQSECSASNDRLLILGSGAGAVSFFEFNYLSTKVEDT
ncbi:hypothetical protein TWF102_003036 [Orbilia oligospora]|uniref:Nephrocystin 3-like N-terminal domain-containing protein n=1 Tax=Orbilia oligospora TaxID=2813651 RepID=A0A7C8NIW5_ORBOL|nr:hypothetical protein TWF102_003036 [Orbilia oligospora]KAF3109347.1 hypothetical protein TWF103_005223 [Orbilia oligospora]